MTVAKDQRPKAVTLRGDRLQSARRIVRAYLEEEVDALDGNIGARDEETLANSVQRLRETVAIADVLDALNGKSDEGRA